MRSKLESSTTVYIAIVLVLVFSSFLGIVANHWPYVAIYILAALFALWHRAWMALIAASSVAIVRSMVALGYHDFWFQMMSAVFAVSFFTVIIRSRGSSRNES